MIEGPEAAARLCAIAGGVTLELADVWKEHNFFLSLVRDHLFSEFSKLRLDCGKLFAGMAVTAHEFCGEFIQARHFASYICVVSIHNVCGEAGERFFGPVLVPWSRTCRSGFNGCDYVVHI